MGKKCPRVDVYSKRFEMHRWWRMYEDDRGTRLVAQRLMISGGRVRADHPHHVITVLMMKNAPQKSVPLRLAGSGRHHTEGAS